jgi:hypothetical protein
VKAGVDVPGLLAEAERRAFRQPDRATAEPGRFAGEGPIVGHPFGVFTEEKAKAIRAATGS